ncbi:MAG: 6,7-dimethyl-8-ribityllumazine synthase [Gammaproteobacteria bacterium]
MDEKVVEMTNTLEVNNGNELKQARIGIVASQFNSFVVDRLLNGCVQTLEQNEIRIDIVRVPGAFEIPVAVQAMIKSTKCNAVIALGAIIRGETPHFDFIASECSRGLATVALDLETPVIFGVLTVDTTEQALDRAGDEESNKGVEAALAAIDMVKTLQVIRG